MKLFNARQTTPSAEDEAATVRLIAIAHRGKGESSLGSMIRPLLDEPEAPPPTAEHVQ